MLARTFQNCSHVLVTTFLKNLDFEKKNVNSLTILTPFCHIRMPHLNITHRKKKKTGFAE